MKVACFWVLMVLLVTVLFGQSEQARIVGTISDATGAVIPGATVTVKNERTGQTRTIAVNDGGRYIVTQLLPTNYTVTAESPGFAKAEYTAFNLQVGEEQTLNITLQPEAVSTEITVSGGGLANVDVSSARISANIPEREVGNLPLNGRQVSQLYLMAPGAVNNGGGNFDNIRFSGRSNQQNIIRYDGVEGSSIVDASPGNLNGESTSQFRLEQSLENVQEFRVDSSNYPAEYGTGTGGQISFITKSGSNEFHGSVFEYLRNNALDARNFFDKSTKSMLRLNQFGASAGGPIISDKAFFFLSYEGLRQHTSAPIVESTLSAAARAQAVPAIQPLLGAFPIGQTLRSKIFFGR